MTKRILTDQEKACVGIMAKDINSLPFKLVNLSAPSRPLANERLLSDSLAESCRYMSAGTRVSKPKRKQHARWVDVLGWVVVAGMALGYIAGAAGQ